MSTSFIAFNSHKLNSADSSEWFAYAKKGQPVRGTKCDLNANEHLGGRLCHLKQMLQMWIGQHCTVDYLLWVVAVLVLLMPLLLLLLVVVSKQICSDQSVESDLCSQTAKINLFPTQLFAVWFMLPISPIVSVNSKHFD